MSYSSLYKDHAMRFSQQAKWIWAKSEYKSDDYARFTAVLPKGKCTLNISYDGNFAAYTDGKLFAFRNCADNPSAKYYDSFEFFSGGELTVDVWHLGDVSQTYFPAPAGVIFSVLQDGEEVAFSSAATPSRVLNEYKNEYHKNITVQLGNSFLYDSTAKPGEFAPSVEVNKSYDFMPRNMKNLVLRERQKSKIERSGDSYIIDLGEETAGFLDLDFTSEARQKILISYGEHLRGGAPARIIGKRDFSVEYIAKKGKNVYLNPFRRLGCRYLQVFASAPISVDYIGLRPVEYPVELIDKRFTDPLDQKIYDVSIRTLKLCMHEHYEDCPWREQALYNLDSRNQMLCGYYAFDSHEYQRANLLLMTQSENNDGLLPICFPCGNNLKIPFFSLCYIQQVYEYVKHTGDESILPEILPTVKRIMRVFLSSVDDNGLIPAFPYPNWNFYEWSGGSDNAAEISRKKDDRYEKRYDLILNCYFVYIAPFYTFLTGEKIDLTDAKRAIDETFLSGDVYSLSTSDARRSQLGQAMAYLAGVADEKVLDSMINDDSLVPATLSMRAFVYDALLLSGKDYSEYILADIRARYKKMLDAGATSFWETEEGKDDFNGAGSLCHGWSAIPVYYFNILEEKMQK